MTPCARCQSPLTTDDLRWYFDGRAEAAMGVRSSHEGFEVMLNAGPPTGYRNGDGAENHVARAIDSGSTARHRCIRTHKLGDVSPHHLEVLRVAYDGQDWTRLLDEQVGRGPRVELQRIFPHEQLQVALLTPSVKRALAPPKATGEGTPVYASMESTLASLRHILALKDKATHVHAVKKLDKVMRWARGKEVRFDAAPIVEQLRVLVGHTAATSREEKIGVVRAARRLLAQSERIESAPVRFVVKTKTARIPTTPAGVLVALLSQRGRKMLARVRGEADKMLEEARRAAGVTDPEVPRGKKRPFDSPGPARSLHDTLAASPLYG